MASSATSESKEFSKDNPVWVNLKEAIASSSGFQRWQMEHAVGEQLQDSSLDYRVRRYLRETLETLAY
ncbi:MAG TPA: hypothetical protein DCE56_09450 [Cyanobacteria bacterium UBA8553]|nr:hypothetical protein [Cyanobacteria bacterium UBA8553]HAJ62497.1 hypothetical protein [Cyanobacteria bacterium UBA8543]